MTWGLEARPARPHEILASARRRLEAGPYEVNISTARLSAPGESRIVVHILKDGKPATDLHPYLGALAHAVFIDAADLSYVHAHPQPLSASGNGGSEMLPLASSSTSSPNMALHVALREAGAYKLWLQFRGGEHLYVAPFVVTAQ